MGRLSSRRAFSFVEVVSAAVILAVVCGAAVATISPMRAKTSRQLIERQSIMLNEMAQTYFQELGRFPADGIKSLIAAGYLADGDATSRARNIRYSNQYFYDTATGLFTRR